MENEFKVELGFVQRRLPWMLAGLMLVVYLVTLSTSATFNVLGTLSQVAGWDWRPAIAAPLHVLVTLPIRWLPAGAQLFALNLLTALFAAATVGLLARSVALLPQDRTKEQRAFERSDYSLLSLRSAWIPPVLAALVCGLQLTFWENAIVATGEALDLLLFAWLIRTLLEYRLDERESRLCWFSFVYGLSVVNNFAMIGFFPAFLVAVAWIKWPAFFSLPFIGRMLAWGAAGLSLYLLLPVVGSLTSEYGFFEMLRTYWGLQKNSLLGMPRYVVLLISLTSILPVIFMGVRWPASLGDVSAAGNALTNLMMHVIHGIFFLACLYVAFDPPFSPRNLGFGRYQLLSFYYLGALSIGYCAGYLLLVFGSKPHSPASWPRRSPLRTFASPIIVGAVWLACFAVPIALLVINGRKVWTSHGASLSRLSAETARSLPERGVVLSDDPARLLSTRLEVEKRNSKHGLIFVDTTQLAQPAYHRALEKIYAPRWPRINLDAASKTPIDSRNQVEMLMELSRSNEVYYLHPSFGFFFEFFYAKPEKAIFHLVRYPPGMISGPPLTAAELQQQDAYWQKVKTEELDKLIKVLEPVNAELKATRFRELPNGLDAYAGMAYSRSLDHFGVEAQRGEDLKMAATYFDLALQCNIANPSAFINQDYNRRLQSGERGSMPPGEEVVKRMAPYSGSWEAILSVNGPVEEPSVSYLMAQTLDRGGLHRQAAQALERCIYFEPTNLAARVGLVTECIQIPLPDKASELISELRARSTAPLRLADELELVRAEAWIRIQKGELAAAEKILNDAQQKYPTEPGSFVTMVQIYLSLKKNAEAFATLERQLKTQPDNASALIDYAAMLISSGKLKESVPYLDRALKITPQEPSGLLNRAIANLYSDPPQVDAALQDYHLLETLSPRAYHVFFGLGECYRLKKNKKEALKYYRKYLDTAPKQTPERRIVEESIRKVETGSF